MDKKPSIPFVFPHAFGACIGNPYDEFRKESDQHAILMKHIGNSIFLTYDSQSYKQGELLGECFDPEKDIVIPPLVNVQRMLLNLKKSKGGKTILKMIKNKTYKRSQVMLMTGRVQLEIKGDPWFAIVVLYGSYQEQTMHPSWVDSHIHIKGRCIAEGEPACCSLTPF